MLLAHHIMLKEVITATSDISIQECIDLLFKRHVGSVVIVDESQRCIGIFAERDAIRVVAQKVPLDAPVRGVMTKKVFTVNENATFEEAKSIIDLHGIRHLPVVDSEGKLVGLISVRYIINEFFGM
ncbi:MAG: CBS domain-containing protein [Candidatus Bathyarchaeota archaeon]|nr:CBS domain-containing protein [Candidatus Bathyarchaeota archaeon]